MLGNRPDILAEGTTVFPFGVRVASFRVETNGTQDIVGLCTQVCKHPAAGTQLAQLGWLLAPTRSPGLWAAERVASPHSLSHMATECRLLFTVYTTTRSLSKTKAALLGYSE